MMFKQTIETRTGNFAAQGGLTLLLALGLGIFLISIGLYAIELDAWILPAVGVFAVVFTAAAFYRNSQYPKEIELNADEKAIRFFNEFGIRKSYVETPWESVVEIRKIDASHVPSNAGIVPFGMDARAIELEGKVLEGRKTRIIGYFLIARNTIYHFSVDSQREAEFLNFIKQLGKYSETMMSWEEFFARRNGTWAPPTPSSRLSA